jgi:hypothetical protein
MVFFATMTGFPATPFMVLIAMLCYLSLVAKITKGLELDAGKNAVVS